MASLRDLVVNGDNEYRTPGRNVIYAIGDGLSSLGDILTAPTYSFDLSKMPTTPRDRVEKQNFNQGVWNQYQDPRDFVAANPNQQKAVPVFNPRKTPPGFQNLLSPDDFSDQSVGAADNAAQSASPAVPVPPTAPTPSALPVVTDMESRWSKLTEPNSNAIPPSDDRQRQGFERVRNGFSPVEMNYIAPGNTPPADLYVKENNGKTRYEIPGLNAIGGGTGYAELQGKRKGGGSFSVVPGGLTEGEKRQLAEINAREQQQREQDQLAAFMDRFTQPPPNMNPLQAQLWQNQQQQLGNFVKMQTEQQAAERLKRIEAEKELHKQNREQANEDRRYYAGRSDAEANQFNNAEQRRLSALQQGQKKDNDLMKLATEWAKPYQVEKPDEMGGKSYAFDTTRYARENAVPDEPQANEIRVGQVYHSPSRNGFVVYDNGGNPAYFTLPDMVYAQLYNRINGR